MDEGEFEFGRRLLANAHIHDASKFYGIEWDALVLEKYDKSILKLAVEHHGECNPHHPEYFGSIHEMDDLHIAEMVCDFKARSVKFGSSLVDWIHNNAMKRYSFTKHDDVYAKIMRFVNLLIDKPFEPLTPQMDGHNA